MNWTGTSLSGKRSSPSAPPEWKLSGMGFPVSQTDHVSCTRLLFTSTYEGSRELFRLRCPPVRLVRFLTGSFTLTCTRLSCVKKSRRHISPNFQMLSSCICNILERENLICYLVSQDTCFITTAVLKYFFWMTSL